MIGKNKINKETFDQLNRRFNWLRKQYREYQEPVNAVKTYKALLNRTLISTTSGLLVTGKTYLITQILDPETALDDFTNVGFVSVGVPFVATGTTPTTWTHSTVVLNLTDSPIIPTVIENTFDNGISFSYPCTANSNGEFLANKTFILPEPGSKVLPNQILFGENTDLTDKTILIEVYP